MIVTLLALAVLLTLVGAGYEFSLLAVSRAELTDAVTKRLRGTGAPIAWPGEV